MGVPAYRSRSYGFPLLHRQAGFLPRGPASHQRARPGPACRSKLSRHPGACGFILSRTVEHHGRVVVEAHLFGSSNGIFWRNPDRTDSNEVVDSEAPLGSDVGQDHRLS